MEKEYILGIDVGGTNIRAGLVDKEYQLCGFEIEESSQIVDEADATGKLTEYIKSYISRHAADRKVSAISIGFPSTIDKSRKVVLSTPNIKGLDNIKVVDSLEESLGITTFINRDVNMLMLFDMYNRSIPDNGITAGFYLGTGLGNAISIEGELLIGKNGVAAELGHIPSRDVNEACGCGNHSCVELFASGKNLRKICDKHFPQTHISEVFKKHVDDPLIQKFVHDLAIPVATEINILDPDYIIIGGGLPQMEGFPRKEFEAAVREYVRKPYPEENLSLSYSVPMQENGVIGAGIYALKQLKKRRLA